MKINQFLSVLTAFANLKGASFISLVNYTAKTSGEIATHVLNVNIDVMNAKQKDLTTLKGVNESKLSELAKSSNIALDTFNMALKEMTESAEKNVSENIEDRTAQSQAQTDAYIQIGKGLKINKESGQLHVFGMAIQKTVHKPGNFQQVNSRPKTIAKNILTKNLELRAGKFRTFIFDNLEGVRINGNTLELTV